MTPAQRNREELGVLILAAGLSSRMGRPKMLLPWQDTTVIQWVVNTYISSGISEIIVVTGGMRHEIENLLSSLPVRIVFNPIFENGEMLDSLKLGLRSFSEEIKAAMIALGDQPRIRQTEIEMVVDGYLHSQASLVVPSYQMRRGHPWVVEKPLWDDLLNLEIPRTLRTFLQENVVAIHYIDVDTPSILMDMDTPDDYERLKRE
ncbi:MAG: NTP transferase domain-containing protein [Anaerolineaceae bacterium]